jgi:hypothetical protein
LVGREAAGLAHLGFLAFAFGEVFEHVGIVRFFAGERLGEFGSSAVRHDCGRALTRGARC